MQERLAFAMDAPSPNDATLMDVMLAAVRNWPFVVPPLGGFRPDSA